MREALVHLAWMHRAARPDKVQKGADAPPTRRGPWRGTSARVHQDLHGARDEAVIHDDILVDVETAISTLEIAGAVAVHAMTQREVLRARRCPDGVGLHEAQCVERALERGRRKEAASNCRAPQGIEGHAAPLSMRVGRPT